MATRKPKKLSNADIAKKYGFRSGFEHIISKQLDELGVPYQYEKVKLEYVWPSRKSTYTCDFVLENGIFIETKGRFLTEDRQKHLLIKEQCPDIDIRFVFMNSRAKLSPTSKTTYASWCEKHGFKYAEKFIPVAWIQEKP